jgi:hypothetical protein
MALVTLMLLLTLYAITTRSEDFIVAEQFVAEDARVSQAIGRVSHVGFRFWSGFESVGGSGGTAQYSFDAATDKGIIVVQVRLHRVGGAWRVQSADFRDRNGVQVVIPIG